MASMAFMGMWVVAGAGVIVMWQGMRALKAEIFHKIGT